jgi:type I restriction enzyme S subunit
LRARTVPSSWIEKEGRRLDCGPYLSGAIEAKVLIEKLPVRKSPLREVTQGGMTGIFNGPKFIRNYVDNPQYGIPFLTSGTMLLADLSNVGLLSRRDAESVKLRYLRISEGMTLITCSGTVGRMAYARPEMEGMWSSQDILKVAPDPDKILPGYLYAYLSSRFGMPLVVGGTYGAIIQHIEPRHIADLPVPRLGNEVEERVHYLVSEAATQRSESSRLLTEAGRNDFINHFDLPRPRAFVEYPRPNVTTASSSHLIKRMDAYFYAQWNQDAFAAFQNVSSRQRLQLGEVTAELYIPDIFKRQYVDDPAYGYPYLTGADVFTIAPTSNKYLSERVPGINRLALRDGMILVQDSGQLGGLIGRPVAVGRYLSGFACTNNMVRIVPYTKADQGYIFAALRSEYGYRLLTREATGSSIPHLEESRIKRIYIPWPSEEVRSSLGEKILRAIDLSDSACDLEARARAMVEQVIDS